MKNHYLSVYLVLFLLVGLLSPLPAQAGPRCGLSEGQTLYIPAYSHIYFGDRERPYLLTVTLSIRNVDPEHSITVTRADYYETQGKYLKKFIAKPVVLKPLESKRYVIPERDESGGSGANFMVDWKSAKPVNAPIVESIMIGTKGQQGISFTSRGRVIIPAK